MGPHSNRDILVLPGSTSCWPAVWLLFVTGTVSTGEHRLPSLQSLQQAGALDLAGLPKHFHEANRNTNFSWTLYSLGPFLRGCVVLPLTFLHVKCIARFHPGGCCVLLVDDYIPLFETLKMKEQFEIPFDRWRYPSAWSLIWSCEDVEYVPSFRTWSLL